MTPQHQAAHDPRSLLERILASPHFHEDDRLGEILLYICYQTQAGNYDALREHDIGVNVLGCEPGYDVQQDPIVSQSVDQLRALLKQYFANEGRRETLRLAIPKGEFRAFFYEADPKDIAARDEPTALEKFWAPYWQPHGGRSYLIHGAVDAHTVLIPEAYLITRVAVLFTQNGVPLEVLPSAGLEDAILARGNVILTGLPEHNTLLARYAERIAAPIVERIWRTDDHGVLTLLTASEPAALLDTARFVTELAHLEKLARKYDQQTFPPFFRLAIE